MNSRGTIVATLLGCVLVAPSCGQDEAYDPRAMPAELPTLSSFAEKPVDELSDTEAQVLCDEELKLNDYCLAVGLVTDSAASCVDAVATCRASAVESQPRIRCDQRRLGLPGSCPVSAGEYLACVGAWAEAQSCEKLGLLIETPAACVSVTTRCPHLALQFYRDGKPSACDPPLSPIPDTSDDIYGLDGCRPLPARLVILGDSIAACFGAFGGCAPHILGNHIKDNLAPQLEVESVAEIGTFTAALPAQAQKIKGGPGHVLVWVQAIGNDLISDHIAWDEWHTAWAQVFAYFTDAIRFPDGTTFLLNTRYSPYDQCPNPLGPTNGVPLSVEQLVQDVNKKLFIDVGIARDDAIAVDHYPDFLGHGQNSNIKGCPHCREDPETWILPDGTHPNTAGHAHMAEKWILALSQMYAKTCPQT